MQYVKRYVDIDGNKFIESSTAIDQINDDLVKNEDWSIFKIISEDSGKIIVVFNISTEDSVTKTNTTYIDSVKDTFDNRHFNIACSE